MSLRRRRAPSHLKKEGALLWRELTTEYGIADAAGLLLVTAAGECLDRMRAAQEAIEKDGEIVIDRYGCKKLHPACKLEMDARTGLLHAFKALNLDIEPLRDGPGRPAGMWRN